jgi:esterase FrsA
VPISDTYRLLSAGDVPKIGWMNTHGGHLGRQKGIWPDPVKFKEVIVPWIVHALDVEPLTK